MMHLIADASPCQSQHLRRLIGPEAVSTTRFASAVADAVSGIVPTELAAHAAKPVRNILGFAAGGGNGRYSIRDY
jgi:hypothetical protein